MINESNPHAAGVLAGHRDGITYIDSRGDTRYFITNSKDQSIKLWDTRVFSNYRAQHNARQIIEHQDWDYRWQPVPKRCKYRNLQIKKKETRKLLRQSLVLLLNYSDTFKTFKITIIAYNYQLHTIFSCSSMGTRLLRW